MNQLVFEQDEKLPVSAEIVNQYAVISKRDSVIAFEPIGDELHDQIAPWPVRGEAVNKLGKKLILMAKNSN